MLQKIINIVKDASQIMLNTDFQISQKTDETNIVTSADLAVQDFLYKNLAPLLPEAGFYGEENKKEIKEYYWLVDPIDGTANFSRNIPLSVISVALIHNNECIIGVVYNPYTDDLYYAEKGNGAYNNGKKISVSNRNFKNSLFCTAMSTYRKEFAPKCFDIIKDAYYDCNDIRRLGSCALELCYLASAKCELFFEIRVYPWDYAASSLILQEAGGLIISYGCNELNFLTPSTIVATNTQENFDKLFKIVKEHLKNGIDLT